ncbi:RNA polymerase sigma factor [Roseicitreum antarcticum]|uniref:RNA polymerase, sigma subunit, ECF family n=2 Tax=Roseicitreum antarcticum TaxID=564137 RepID=A0A1H3C3T2_9RHOB|nr:RNA polymerase sigma factor [Roseicitreum antarcticum]SDX48751.1 RNA polymerase, sigma subunit, ECF family [Roseicitreum antarcticum]
MFRPPASARQEPAVPSSALSAPAVGYDPDAALLAAYAQGDAAAGAALTAQLAPRLLRYAARLLGDLAEAEDVTQDAMLRLWRIAPQWRAGEAKVSTWAYHVTANLCTDRLRRRRSRPGVALDQVAEPPDPGRGAEAGMIEADRAQALELALQALPDRQRQAVVLRHLEGLSNPEIAAILDTGIEAVESLIARGKRALTARLSGQRAALGYDDD